MSKGKKTVTEKKAGSVTITVSLPQDVAERLDNLVATQFGKRSPLVAEFIRRGLKGAAK